MKPLYKTTIVIWTEHDPNMMELVDLARDATDGMSYCSKQDTKYIHHPENDEEFECGEFFNDDEFETPLLDDWIE